MKRHVTIWKDKVMINDIGEEERVRWGERQPLVMMSWLRLSRARRGPGLSAAPGGWGAVDWVLAEGGL